GFYQKYNSLFLDISLFIISVVIAYFTANKLHQTYYTEEQKHPIVLDDSFLEDCAYEGMRQSRIESNVVILSFLFAVVTFIIFFSVNSITPLILVSISTSVFLFCFYIITIDRSMILYKYNIKI